MQYNKWIFTWTISTFFSDNTCITTDAVNRAFATARERVRLTSPARSMAPTEAEVDLIARAVVETTRLLAEE